MKIYHSKNLDGLFLIDSIKRSLSDLESSNQLNLLAGDGIEDQYSLKFFKYFISREPVIFAASFEDARFDDFAIIFRPRETEIAEAIQQHLTEFLRSEYIPDHLSQDGDLKTRVYNELEKIGKGTVGKKLFLVNQRELTEEERKKDMVGFKNYRFETENAESDQIIAGQIFDKFFAHIFLRQLNPKILPDGFRSRMLVDEKAFAEKRAELEAEMSSCGLKWTRLDDHSID